MTRFLRRFLQDEGGNATVEFVIVFPLLFALFLSTIELGVVLTRQAMLDRAVDLAVREVRLGSLQPVDHETLRDLICSQTILIHDCTTQLKLEMVRMDPRGSGSLGTDIDCIDRANPSVPASRFSVGGANELMILRACVLQDPVSPTAGFGLLMIQERGDAYAIVTTAAYAVEPD